MTSFFTFMKQTMLWWFNIIVFAVIFVLLLMFIPSYEEGNLDVHNIQSFIFKERVLNCFSDGEMHKINLNKFDEVSLKNCINPNANIGGKFSLKFLNNSLYKEIKINDYVIEGSDFCNLKGSPYMCSSYRDYILSFDGNDVIKSIIEAEVITKR